MKFNLSRGAIWQVSEERRICFMAGSFCLFFPLTNKGGQVLSEKSITLFFNPSLTSIQFLKKTRLISIVSKYIKVLVVVVVIRGLTRKCDITKGQRDRHLDIMTTYALRAAAVKM